MRMKSRVTMVQLSLRKRRFTFGVDEVTSVGGEGGGGCKNEEVKLLTKCKSLKE